MLMATAVIINHEMTVLHISPSLGIYISTKKVNIVLLKDSFQYYEVMDIFVTKVLT